MIAPFMAFAVIVSLALYREFLLNRIFILHIVVKSFLRFFALKSLTVVYSLLNISITIGYLQNVLIYIRSPISLLSYVIFLCLISCHTKVNILRQKLLKCNRISAYRNKFKNNYLSCYLSLKNIT